MKNKLLLLLLACSVIPLAVMAETKETREALKHEVRIGYGDPMYETMRWKDEPNKLGVPMNVRQNYRYTGHIYGEYMYRVNSWLGVGGQDKWISERRCSITTRISWIPRASRFLPPASRARSMTCVLCRRCASRTSITNG